jgi:class 3 adenylate cyclase
VSTTPLIGRRAELARLDELLRNAIDGHPSFVVIDGDAGIGKSRLAREVVERAAARGIAALSGRCYEHVEVPYFPLLDSVIPALAEATHGDHEMAVHAEVVDRFLGRTPADGSDLTHAVPELVAASIELARRQPILVLIEDLHWADDGTLDVVTHLAFRAADQARDRAVPLLLLVTYRSGHDARRDTRLRRLAQEELTVWLRLGGLTDEEASLLVAEAGVPDDRLRIATRLNEIAGGNPLFLDALARQVEGMPASALAGPQALRHLDLPADVEEAVAARLAPLSPDSREILTVAAFLGARCSADVLVSVARADPDRVVDAVEEAMEAGIVAEEGDEIVFTSPLYRRACYTATSSLRATRLHGDIARALIERHEAGQDDLLPAIAHHLLQAGRSVDRRELFRYAVAAADWSHAVGAWAQAADLYDAALDAAEDLSDAVDDSQRAQLLYRAALSSSHAGSHDRSLARLAEAVPCFEGTGDIVGLVRALVYRQRILQSEGQFTSRSNDELEQAIRRLDEVEPALAAEARADVAYALWHAGHFEEARAAAERALEQAGRLEAHAAISRAAVVRGVTAMTLVDVQGAIAAFEEAVAAARSTGTPMALQDALLRYSMALYLGGRLDDAERVARETLAVLDELGLAEGGAQFPRAALLQCHTVRGDFAAAEAEGYAAALEARRHGRSWTELFVDGMLAAGRAARGDLDAALDALRNVGRNPSDERLATGSPPDRVLAAWIHGESGQTEAARRLLHAGPLPSFDGPPLLGRTTLAAALVELAFLLDEPALLSDAIDNVEMSLQRGKLLCCALPLFLPRIAALGDAVRGDRDLARKRLAVAQDQARAVGAVVEEARCALDRAELAAASGDDDAAATIETEAVPLVERLGLASLRARLAALGGARLTLEQFARSLRVLLMVDMSDSTRLSRELGDMAFLERKRRLERLLLGAVGRHGGRAAEGISLGDGVLALFPTAESALLAAAEAVERAQALGLQVHAGLHAGDVIVEHGRVHGLAVNTAARFCDAAGAGEIAVSDAVRRLAGATSAFSFEPRGERAMKGLEKPQQFFLASR